MVLVLCTRRRLWDAPSIISLFLLLRFLQISFRSFNVTQHLRSTNTRKKKYVVWERQRNEDDSRGVASLFKHTLVQRVHSLVLLHLSPSVIFYYGNSLFFRQFRVISGCDVMRWWWLQTWVNLCTSSRHVSTFWVVFMIAFTFKFTKNEFQ